MKHTFLPVIDPSSTILILGSFPSVKSREASFYYMHPSNRFWRLMDMIFYDHFSSVDIEEKIDQLHKHHIALYDVIEQCEIEGSKDSSIESVVVHDIINMIRDTQIKKIFLNGKKAASLFHKHFPTLKDMATDLPSTSSANARYSLEDLFECWKIIKAS